MNLLVRLTASTALFFIVLQGYGQMIGNRQNGMPSPMEMKPTDIKGASISGDVNTYDGSLGLSYKLGSVSTVSGLSFSLEMSYSSTTSCGDNVPLLKGTPYGEGWGLSLPSVRVRNIIYNKYTPIEYARSLEAPFNDLLTYTKEEMRKEAKPYWYMPFISIPGVVGEYFVFKYTSGNKDIYVPLDFESYMEAAYDGSSWTVTTQDGTVYELGMAQTNVVAPSNQRYQFQDDEYLTEESLKLHEGTFSADPSMIVPSVQPLQWYCTKISHPSHPRGQAIIFNYDKFGGFNYFKEFCAPQMEATFKDVFNTTVSEEALTAYSDIVLKEIKTVDFTGTKEFLVLNYETKAYEGVNGADALNRGLIPAIELPNVLLQKDPLGASGTNGVTAFDAMYNKKVIYDAQSDGFSNWKRVLHATEVPFTNYPGNANDPYAISDGRYYGEPASGSIQGASFKYGFLESPRLDDPSKYFPGEIYEIATQIQSSNFGLYDINLGSGHHQAYTCCVESPYMDGERYKAENFSSPVFTTFNQPMKWAGKSFFNTSNLFLMPNKASGNKGFKIQVGPANSDVNNQAKSTHIFDQNSNEALTYRAYHQYRDHPSNHFPLATNPENYTGSQVQYLRFAPVARNFGIGMPWKMMYALYHTYNQALGYGGGGNNIPFRFWYVPQDHRQGNPNPHKPTIADENSKLINAQLIRYGRNPYMLSSVEHYNLHGEVIYDDVKKDEGWKLVEKYTFNYSAKPYDAYRFNFGDVVNQTLDRYRTSVVLLTAINSIPVDMTTYTEGSHADARSASFFYTLYEKAPTKTQGAGAPTTFAFEFHNTYGYFINRVLDEKGLSTAYVYNEAPIISSDANPYLNLNNVTDLEVYKNEIDPLPTVMSLKATIAKKVINLGDGLPDKEWIYTYSTFQTRKDPNLTNGIYFQRLKNTTIPKSRQGFKFVTVKGPELSTSGKTTKDFETTVYEYYSDNLIGKLKSVTTLLNGTKELKKTVNTYTRKTAYINGLFISLPPSGLSVSYQYPTSGNLITNVNQINPELKAFSTSGREVKHLDNHFKDAIYLDGYTICSNFISLDKTTNSTYYYRTTSVVPNINVVLDAVRALTGTNVIVTATTEQKLSIDQVSDYMYYGASERGLAYPEWNRYISGRADPVMLGFDPSWQVFTKKSYSPQLPGVSTTNFNFHYFDLIHDPSYQSNPVFYATPGIETPLYCSFSQQLRTIPLQQTVVSSSPGKPDNSFSTYNFYNTRWNITTDLDNNVERVELRGLTDAQLGPVSDCPTSGPGTPDPVCPPPGSERYYYLLRNSDNCPGGFRSIRCNNGDVYCHIDPDNPTEHEFTSGQGGIDGTGSIDFTKKDTIVSIGEDSKDLEIHYLVRNVMLLKSVTQQAHTLKNGAAPNSTLPIPLLRFTYNNDPQIASVEPIYPYDVVTTKYIKNRNYLGQERLVENERGLQTRYYYNLPDLKSYDLFHASQDPSAINPCKRLGGKYSIALGKPYRITVGFGDNDSLVYDMEYNASGAMTYFADANSTSYHYSYDGFKRLAEVSRNNKLLANYTYHLSKGGGDYLSRTSENYILTRSYLNDPDQNVLTSKSFFDPLGRDYVTLTERTGAAGTAVASGRSDYDEWSRVIRSYKGFNVSMPDINTAPASVALGSTAFSENIYEANYRSRPLKQVKPGQNISNGRAVNTMYGIISGTELRTTLGLTIAEAQLLMPACSTSCPYWFETRETLDEDEKRLRIYTDALGRKVAESRGSGTSAAITLFAYDSRNLLTDVIPPNKMRSTYAYNLWGLAHTKTSPDAGTVNYLYDRSGNITAERDAKSMTAGTGEYARLRSYDKFGRNTAQYRLEGAVASIAATHGFDFIFAGSSSLDAAIGGTLKKEKEFNYHLPDNPLGTLVHANARKFLSGLQTFTAGRLSSCTSYKNSGKPIEISYYAYNADGFTAWEMKQFNPNGIDQSYKGILSYIEYPLYNSQGSALVQNIDINSMVGSDGKTRLDLQVYKNFDAYNRLQSVYANFDNSRQNGNKIAMYTYDDALGLLSSTKYFYRPTAAQDFEVDHISNTYDVRNRLTNLDSRLFSEVLTYDANSVTGASQNYNGNINGTNSTYKLSQTTVSGPLVNFEGPSVVAYRYDGMNRLVSADARVQFTAANTTNTFVGDELYSYDAVGNITAADRGIGVGATNTARRSPMLYSYYPNTNRLRNVNLANNGTLDVQGITNEVNNALRNSVGTSLPNVQAVQLLPSASYTYDANGNMIREQGNIHGNDIEILYGRANLPYYMKRSTAGPLQESYYQYDCKDSRIFKYSAPQSTNLSAQAFYYLRDVQGHEIGILDMNSGDWEWYVQGAQRAARIVPSLLQKPEYFDGDFGGSLSPASVMARHNPDFQQQLGAVRYSLQLNNSLPDQLLKLRKMKSTDQLPVWMLQKVYTGPHKPVGQYGIVDGIDIASGVHLLSGLSFSEESAPEQGDLQLYTLSAFTGTPQNSTSSGPSGPGAPPYSYGPPLIENLELYNYDHLGNTRVVYSPQVNAGVLSYALKGVYDYYPSGKLLRSYSANNDQKNERYLTTQHERDAESGYDFRNARFSDSEIGGIFRQVDPMADQYPGWTPYKYGFSNPIMFLDPTGMNETDLLNADGTLNKHIEDGSNAVFQKTGSGVSEHYEFKKFDEAQGGENKANVTTIIQEQQIANMSNPSLQQVGSGGTHCNQATQAVQMAAQSAMAANGEKVNLVTPGRANDISQNLADNKHPAYKSATQAEAITAAKKGSIAMVAYKNPAGSGHVATLSVGSNILKGTLANIGVKGSTGFVPITGARNAAYRAEHAIKFYILNTNTK